MNGKASIVLAVTLLFGCAMLSSLCAAQADSQKVRDFWSGAPEPGKARAPAEDTASKTPNLSNTGAVSTTEGVSDTSVFVGNWLVRGAPESVLICINDQLLESAKF